jgi:hypothetical protein
VVAELLHAEPFPPRFTFGVDEFGNLYFLENVVVWHVILDAIVELQLYNDINSLDSIFCAAAVAVSCALEELATGRFIQNEFGGEAYLELYNNLLDHLRKNCLNPSLLGHWNEFKYLTHMRLMQICR